MNNHTTNGFFGLPGGQNKDKQDFLKDVAYWEYIFEQHYKAYYEKFFSEKKKRLDVLENIDITDLTQQLLLEFDSLSKEINVLTDLLDSLESLESAYVDTTASVADQFLKLHTENATLKNHNNQLEKSCKFLQERVGFLEYVIDQETDICELIARRARSHEK